MKKNVIIDCDPGHDDAIALLMALASKRLNVLGITTSAGNQTPEKTHYNARKILSLIKKEDIVVAMGASKPLVRELIIADDIHGETGLDGADLPEPTVPKSEIKAINFMKDILQETEEKVSIIATGPLTNIAILLLSYPELKSKIELISIMGGACFGGNWTPNAEFNIYVDPEAADVVFKSKVPVAMFGLDVTHKAQFYKEDIEKLRDFNSQTGNIMADLLDFFHLTTSVPFLADEDHIEGIHMHDPCAVAYVIDPSLFTMVETNVEVVTTDGLSLGQTVVDYNQTTGKAPNALVGFDVDLENFNKLIIDSIGTFR